MNLYLKHTLFYLLGISYALISSAQSNPDKLQCKVTGRMLLDGGVYLKMIIILVMELNSVIFG